MRRLLVWLAKRSPIYSLYYYIGLNVWTKDDQDRFDFYRPFINPGDLVFDVGANKGNRTKIFLKLGARVVAFEPQGACFRFLSRAFKGVRNLWLVKKAVGAGEGEVDLFIGSADTLSTLSEDWMRSAQQSGRFRQCSWGRKERVEVTTLDRAIQEYGIPSFIKIDVEGYEYEVLSGLSSPIRCISIEYAAENIMRTYRCIERVDSSTVSFQITEGEAMAFCLPSWVTSEDAKRRLALMTNQNPLAMGDLYIRNTGGISL